MRQKALWSCLLAATVAGVTWLWFVIPPQFTGMLPISQLTALQGPVVAAMDSPAFVYEKEWSLSATGADPKEPAEPWQEPAGALRFTYTGAELALLLAAGDYWGYLYVTVDGQPANLLPTLRGNENSVGENSGYRTLYAPEQQSATGTTPQWVRIHHATDPEHPHAVYIEVWRSWGQTPVRAVAIDGLPPKPLPVWPGVAFLMVAGWLGGIAITTLRFPAFVSKALTNVAAGLQPLLAPSAGKAVAPALAGGAIFVLGLGTMWAEWTITLAALLLLAWCGLQRPALWVAGLLLGLPFYYSWSLPILPTRAVGLIDIGILGGLGMLTGHWLLLKFAGVKTGTPGAGGQRQADFPSLLLSLVLVGIIGWALLATVQADRVGLAFREWRTVFLTGGFFALLLINTLRLSTQPAADQRLLLGAWITGATLVALVGLWQYAGNEGLIMAEGVQRVRAFYGSPNNLALYLERALAPLLAFALFAQRPRVRWLTAGIAFIVGSALLLTFSKGALLLGLPAMLAVLGIGGLSLLQQRGQSRRPLWAIGGIGGVALLALAPFLGTERFQRLLDFQGGTGFVRLQLWRSAWQMALDHPFFGVGPDNFLYAYRSLYLLPTAWQEPNLNHPHNWPLDWWTRVGLPGLLLAMLWFSILLFRQWRRLRANQQPVLSLGLLAASVAALAHGLIDASYALPDLMIIWVLLSYLPPNADPSRS